MFPLARPSWKRTPDAVTVAASEGLITPRVSSSHSVLGTAGPSSPLCRPPFWNVHALANAPPSVNTSHKRLPADTHTCDPRDPPTTPYRSSDCTRFTGKALFDLRMLPWCLTNRAPLLPSPTHTHRHPLSLYLTVFLLPYGRWGERNCAPPPSVEVFLHSSDVLMLPRVTFFPTLIYCLRELLQCSSYRCIVTSLPRTPTTPLYPSPR